MYNPAHFVVDSPDEILGMLRSVAFGHMVTRLEANGSGGSGLTATPLPFVVNDALTTVRAHVARANPAWRDADGATALLIVPGNDAYVSPRWYPSKAEHGKVVPTWNYEVVHLHGTLEVRDEAEWKRQMVEDLTNVHEAVVSDAERPDAWQVSDAPDDFIAGQVKAIVGIQFNVTSIEGKRKLSQNKPEVDRVGATEGLSRSDRQRDQATAQVMTQRSD